MLLKDEVDLLRKVPLFSHLEPAKLKLLAFTSTRKLLTANSSWVTTSFRPNGSRAVELRQL